MIKLLTIVIALGAASCSKKQKTVKDFSPFAVAAAQRGEANPLKERMLKDELTQIALNKNVNPEAPSGKAEPKTKGEDKIPILDINRYDAIDGAAKYLPGYKANNENLGVKPMKPINPKPLVKVNHNEFSNAFQKPKPKPIARKVSTRPRSVKKSRPRKKSYDMESIMLASSLSKGSSVTGRSPGYESVEDNLLKRGSEYLAVIKDAEIISRGSKAFVVGVLSSFAVTRPYKLYAEMTLNRTESRVDVKVTHCIGLQANALSINCGGVVKGIDGASGLTGEIYNPAVWGIALKSLATMGSAYMLERMTRTVTSDGGVLVNQTKSNAILAGLSDGINAFAGDKAAEWAKMGTTITLPGNAVVKVLITEDTVLWSDARDMSREPVLAMNSNTGRF